MATTKFLFCLLVFGLINSQERVWKQTAVLGQEKGGQESCWIALAELMEVAPMVLRHCDPAMTQADLALLSNNWASWEGLKTLEKVNILNKLS